MGWTTDSNAPTPLQVWDESKLKWNRLGFHEPSDISEIVEDGIGYVEWISGRYFDDFPLLPIQVTTSTDVYDFPLTPQALATTPAIIRLAKRAVRMRVEQMALQDQPGYAETAADDVIQSFSAGGYSETRASTSSLRGGRYQQKPLINSHPGLNDLLMQLMTDERRIYWNYVLTGSYPPAFESEEVDWSLVGKSPIFPNVAGDPAAPFPSLGYPWWE